MKDYDKADCDIAADVAHAKALDHHKRGNMASEAVHRAHHGKALAEHGNEGMRSDLSRGHVIEHG